MMLAAGSALSWCARITGAGIALGSLELWQLRPTIADDGIWKSRTIQRELDVLPGARAIGWLLRPRPFALLLVTRFFAALLLSILGFGPATAVLAPSLLALQLLVQLRWRGTFNGGSDFMTLVVLVALTVAGIGQSHATAVTGAALYIAVQAATSYFLAGWAKLRRASWRDGRALRFFAATTIFATAPWPRALFGHRVATTLLGWATLLFECTFPLALMVPRITWPYLLVGLLFHLGNAWVFGLNRFVVAWLATYPAVLYCSRFLN